MSDPQKLNAIALDCKLANAIAKTLKDQLMGFLPSFSEAVHNDSAGCTGPKDKDLEDLIHNMGVLTEVMTLTDTIQQVIK